MMEATAPTGFFSSLEGVRAEVERLKQENKGLRQENRDLRQENMELKDALDHLQVETNEVLIYLEELSNQRQSTPAGSSPPH